MMPLSLFDMDIDYINLYIFLYIFRENVLQPTLFVCTRCWLRCRLFHNNSVASYWDMFVNWSYNIMQYFLSCLLKHLYSIILVHWFRVGRETQSHMSRVYSRRLPTTNSRCTPYYRRKRRTRIKFIAAALYDFWWHFSGNMIGADTHHMYVSVGWWTVLISCVWHGIIFMYASNYSCRLYNPT